MIELSDLKFNLPYIDFSCFILPSGEWLDKLGEMYNVKRIEFDGTIHQPYMKVIRI